MSSRGTEFPPPHEHLKDRVRQKKLEPRQPRMANGHAPDTAQKATNGPDRFKMTLLADIVLDDEPLWLVDGLIPSGPSLGVFFGKPKSGKTFMTTSLFLHVAMGRDYCGCAVRPGAVVYITSEGVRGFKRRMVAMREHHEADIAVPFYTVHTMPNLGMACRDAQDLIAAIHASIPEGTAVAAIVVDTLARAMTGQSDSDGAAMGVFVGNCDTIARAFDCFVGAVHHSPRNDDSRSRGSNVLDGAADVIISVVKDDASGISTAKVDRLKDGEEGATWRFRVAPVEVVLRNKGTCFAPLRNIGNSRAERRNRNKAKQKTDRLSAALHGPPRRGDPRPWRDRHRFDGHTDEHQGRRTRPIEGMLIRRGFS